MPKREGKGTHRAGLYALHRAKHAAYFLKLDVRKYFDSVSHAVLKTRLCSIMKDRKVLSLLFDIIDSYNTVGKEIGYGLPIGNLTSQFFANEYVCTLDRFVIEKIKPKGFVRYMDDMVLFADDSAVLKNAFEKMTAYIEYNLKCSLKPPILGRVKDGVPFLGWRITDERIFLLRKSKIRSEKTIRKINNLACSGMISESEAFSRIQTVKAVRRCKVRNI